MQFSNLLAYASHIRMYFRTSICSRFFSRLKGRWSWTMPFAYTYGCAPGANTTWTKVSYQLARETAQRDCEVSRPAKSKRGCWIRSRWSLRWQRRKSGRNALLWVSGVPRTFCATCFFALRRGGGETAYRRRAFVLFGGGEVHRDATLHKEKNLSNGAGPQWCRQESQPASETGSTNQILQVSKWSSISTWY